MDERHATIMTELDDISDILFDIIVERGELEVKEVVDEAIKRKGLRRHNVIKSIYKLREMGAIDILDPNPPKNVFQFLFSSRATWFWVLSAIVLLTDLSIYIFPQSPPISYVRYLLGSILVLFLPGASLIELLYPKGDEISRLERFALSIGLSIAVVPLVGLLLNYTPWGIRLDPIVISLSLLTLILSLAAIQRKYWHHISTTVK